MFTDGRDHHQRMNGAIAGGLAFVSVLFQVYSLEPRLDIMLNSLNVAPRYAVRCTLLRLCEVAGQLSAIN